MIELMFVEIAAKALVLCLILFLVARHEADYSFLKVAMITAAIGLGTMLIDVLCRPHIGWFALLPVIAFVMFILMKFCWISLTKAAIVTVIFMAFCVVFSMGVTAVIAPVNKSMQTAMTRRPTDKKDFDQVFKIMKMENPITQTPKQPEQQDTLDTALAKTTGTWFSKIKGWITSFNKIDTGAETGLLKKGTATDIKIIQKSVLHNNVTAKTKTKEYTIPNELCDWAGAKAKLKISATITGGQGDHMAIINRQTIKEGENVAVEHKKNIYSWKISKITKDGIDWQQIDVIKAK